MKNLFIPPLLVLYSIILMTASWFFLPEFNRIPFPVNFTGIAVAFSGFVLMGKSRDLFTKHKTTLAYDEPSYLITEGVFSKTRNPMYLGMFILLLGIGLCFRNIFSVSTALVFLLILHLGYVPREEKTMLKTFGQDYIKYRKNVRRWI